MKPPWRMRLRAAFFSAPELRAELAVYASQVGVYRREELQVSQWMQITQPFLNSNIRALDWIPPAARAGFDLPDPRVRTDWDRLLADPEFQSIVLNQYLAADATSDFLGRFSESARRIVRRIDLQLR